MLGLSVRSGEAETELIDWLGKYAPPIVSSFTDKAGTYVFRLSYYLDMILDAYYGLGYKGVWSDQESVKRAVFSIKSNILLSVIASVSCLSQGLFLQSGAVLRCMFEECFLLLDIFENKKQLRQFLDGTYSARGVVSRIKKLVPKDVVSWYGYLSANFTHAGPLHPAPYLPAACYPDNYVLVIGFQNIVRAVVTLHIVLERVHFSDARRHFFWKQATGGTDLVFDENSSVFSWTEALGKEMVKRYPPDERKDWLSYDTKGYRAK
jgi:hypothetical protein